LALLQVRGLAGGRYRWWYAVGHLQGRYGWNFRAFESWSRSDSQL